MTMDPRALNDAMNRLNAFRFKSIRVPPRRGLRATKGFRAYAVLFIEPARRLSQQSHVVQTAWKTRSQLPPSTFAMSSSP